MFETKTRRQYFEFLKLTVKTFQKKMCPVDKKCYAIILRK